ncbi:hypothetical protein LDO26_00630 [Luteimonas sp. BDR2-5]|uniref:hypothetical protein n=1 Tax=Proluteimonas luteida TaxID=2878685 RepID=UPI001E418387|nr:hypothetical protein [Luteimonas sp. BDR2-5]MCD9026719.1 hypothetical protein [Luteimonas sp. BDR2-5]
MGESWFMGETRRMFDALMGDPETVPPDELHDALQDIAAGTHAFGAVEEWQTWFHYLLPRVVPRAHELVFWPLLEMTVTAFITQYPRGIVEASYPRFREDVLVTLGRAMMAPACWRDGRIVLGTLLRRQKWPSGIWGWHDASGDLSASLFLHLKYLVPEEVPGWMASVLAIACPYWRAQLLVWCVGAHGALTGRVDAPANFREPGVPSVEWVWSHCLDQHFPGEPAPFFPRANCQAALDAIAATMDETKLLEWVLSIAEDAELEAELFDIPDRFRALYL